MEIEALEVQLRRDGQKAVIVIFTDGESSDGNVATAMQPLRHLPVHVSSYYYLGHPRSSSRPCYCTALVA